MKDLEKLLEDSLVKLETAQMLTAKYDAWCGEEIELAVHYVSDAMGLVKYQQAHEKTS